MSVLNFQIKKQGIAWIEWDDKNSSTNVLSISLLEEFASVIEKIKKENVKVAVLVSKKENVFVAGADIKEIQGLKTKQEFRQVLQKAHDLLNELENLKVSKIAVINGACLGGGLELALAFDYRIASDSKKVQIGLPEVKLGIIPGFGGCIRLPRLLGLQQALPMILQGKSYSGYRAYKKGLVHECVPDAILEQRALELAEQILLGKKAKHPSQRYKKKNLLEVFLKPLIFLLTKKAIIKETKGFYPAPLVALKVIKKTYNKSHLKSLKIEMEAFCELAVGDVSKNLIKLFFNMQEVKKISLSENKKPCNRIGVLGAGIMGGGIAYACADKHYPVRLKDVNEKSISQSLKKAHGLWNKQLKTRRIDTYECEKRKTFLTGSLDYYGFSNLDLVIEAVSEEMDIKKMVIAEASNHVNPNTIFASNTSSLSISELAKIYPYPENFIGMHFFNPVYKMPLVEIIKTDQSSPEALSVAFELAKKIGKTPIIVKDSACFIVNRMLVPYLTEALWLLHDGQDIKKVDAEFSIKFGMPMGPFRLMDEVGLDICNHVIATFKKAYPDLSIPEGVADLTQQLGLGKKQGQGFYIYKDGSKHAVNPKTESLKKSHKDISSEDIISRGIYRIINEGYKVLEEKVAATEQDIDTAMILGTGFPPFLGGPMTYARGLGLASVKKDLEEYSKELGPRFQPCRFLASY